MGVASSPGPQRALPARRSIRFTFLAMVAVPVLCLVLLWGLLAGFAPGGALGSRGLFSAGHHGLAQIAVAAGTGVVVILVAVLLTGFARRLRREISSLEATARVLADTQLPRVMQSLRDESGPAGLDEGFEPPATRIKEIAAVAAAITSLRHAAVAAAAEEARLRNGIAQVFVGLARRSQSLLQRQLHLIDTLEKKATDPAELGDLFSLDHLTTRMRRHAENLIILSGASPGRSWSAPVPVIDVIRGAMAEVEDYQRVRVLTRSQDAVIGSAVADMIHLVAELIENATLFSPSGTRVEVRAERVANGFVIEVEDRGLGIQPGLLTEINQKLIEPPGFALADPDRLGLFVVGRLAARHGIKVTLTPSPYGGTTAVMLIPHGIVVALPAAKTAIPAGEPQQAEPAARELPGPDRRPEAAFALTARRVAPEAGAGPLEDRVAPAEVPAAAPATAAGPAVAGSAAAGGSAAAAGSAAASGSAAAAAGQMWSAPVSAGAPAETFRGLPRRVRQAGLSAPPKAGGPAITEPLPAGSATAPAVERTPERARDVVAAFRSGWQRDLPAEVLDAQGGARQQVAGPPGPSPGPPPRPAPGLPQREPHREPRREPPREERKWMTGDRPDPEQT